jgi:hypothetical protein
MQACCAAVLKECPPQQAALDASEQAHWMNMVGNPGQHYGCGDAMVPQKPGGEDGGQRMRCGRLLDTIGQALSLDRLHVEHLVGGAEAIALVEGTPGVGGV